MQRYSSTRVLIWSLTLLLIVALIGLAVAWNQLSATKADRDQLQSEVHDQSVQIEQLSATPSATPTPSPTATPKATATPVATPVPARTPTPKAK